MSKYTDRMDLEYLVIDLYDYTYFNYDVSFSKNALDYYSFGGFCEDEHHFFQNKNFEGLPLHDWLEKYRNWELSADEMELRKQLFQLPFCDNPWWAEDFPSIKSSPDYYGDYIPNIWRTNTALNKINSLPLSMVGGHTNAFQRNEKTIAENVDALDRLLTLARQYNKDIKIFCVMLPRYYLLERNNEYVFASWKIDFMRIIEHLKQKHKFTFFDFKGSTEFSGNGYFYQDEAHFNTIGARAFTACLNKLIQANK